MCCFEAAFGIWAAGAAGLMPGAEGMVAAQWGQVLQGWLCWVMVLCVPLAWDSWAQRGRALHARAGSSPLPEQAATPCRCGTGTTCRAAR